MNKLEALNVFDKYLENDCPECAAEMGELCFSDTVWVHLKRMLIVLDYEPSKKPLSETGIFGFWRRLIVNDAPAVGVLGQWVSFETTGEDLRDDTMQTFREDTDDSHHWEIITFELPK